MSGSESAARVIFTGAGIAVAVVAMLHGSGAFAQSTGVQPTPVVSQTTITPVYDNQMLTAFARAARDISGLRNRYMPRITAANIAERTERAEALFDEMRARMHDAIDAAGLTIPDYEGISAASARDCRFAQPDRYNSDRRDTPSCRCAAYTRCGGTGPTFGPDRRIDGERPA